MNPYLHAMGFIVFMFLVFLIVTDGYEDDNYSAWGNILRVLRFIGRALRWLFDRFSLGIAWFSVCTAVLVSFINFLAAWDGLSVLPFECWPVFAMCLGAWGFERLYVWECESDARYQAFQRGEL